jgi:hypothetical protein
LIDDINGLYHEILGRQGKREVVRIPFVIAAMDSRDTEDIATHSELQKFVVAVRELVDSDILSKYPGSREDWKPIGCNGESIRSIIEGVTQHLNELWRDQPSAPIMQPDFVSKDFFSKQYDIRRTTWQRCKNEGCIVVVDAISLFHPWISRLISDSAVSLEDKRVAMLVISPNNARDVVINMQIDAYLQIKHHDVYWRYKDRLDKHCEIGIGDLKGLRRWLAATIPETMIALKRPAIHTGYEDLIRNELGYSPQGIEQWWSARI